MCLDAGICGSFSLSLMVVGVCGVLVENLGSFQSHTVAPFFLLAVFINTFAKDHLGVKQDHCQ
jgi:hypothetical protein